jgi:hypothetical protein
MIKREALRFNNWVYGSVRPGEPVQINSIDKTICKAGEYLEDYTSVNGIPLTEEWLINNAGFKSDDMADLGSYVHLPIYHPYLYLTWNEGSIWIGEYDTKCKYVHQFQNIFFALTQAELTIKL